MDNGDIIYVRKDVFPDYNSKNIGDLTCVRAVLAHEYWGRRFMALYYPEYVGLGVGYTN